MVAARSRPARAATSGWARIAIVSGLLGLAVTQPVLDLFGRNPTFFTAGSYTSSQIIGFALVVTLVPTLVAGAGLALTSRLHEGAGRVAYVVLIAVLGAVFGNVLLRGLGVDRTALAIVAAAGGAAAVLAVHATNPGRLLLQYLCLGNVLFLLAFLFASPTAELLGDATPSELGSVEVPELAGPVIVVVLDELPLTTLLRDDGTINAERFPRFAELAERSTWFRNASSHHPRTHLAVPTLLTGELAEESDVPNHVDHPRNLLTLLGQEVPVDRYEPITDLCPPELCDPKPPQPLAQAVEDAAVVYGHRVLPSRLRDPLPDIGTSWGSFGDDLGTTAPAIEVPEGTDLDFIKLLSLPTEEQGPVGQAGVLAQRTAAIGPEPAVHMLHVLWPHQKWVVAPTGTRLMDLPAPVAEPADPDYEWSARQQFQLHSMQVGAADVSVGSLIDHLDAEGIWDDTTLVVTSDHGMDLTAPDFGREPSAASVQELLRVPLFIHAPGLAEGEVVDDPAQTVDLLPTLVDVLDVETDWTFDGHSLVDGSPGSVEPLVGEDFAPALGVVRRHAADFRGGGTTWTDLAAVGEHAALVGVPVDDLEVVGPSGLSWTPDHEAELATLPTAEGRAPQLLAGVVRSPATGPPPEVLVVVNGTVAGVAGGYRADGDGWRFTAFLGPFLADGANRFEAYEVVEGTTSTLRWLG